MNANGKCATHILKLVLAKICGVAMSRLKQEQCGFYSGREIC